MPTFQEKLRARLDGSTEVTVHQPTVEQQIATIDPGDTASRVRAKLAAREAAARAAVQEKLTPKVERKPEPERPVESKHEKPAPARR